MKLGRQFCLLRDASSRRGHERDPGEQVLIRTVTGQAAAAGPMTSRAIHSHSPAWATAVPAGSWARPLTDDSHWATAPALVIHRAVSLIIAPATGWLITTSAHSERSARVPS
ncbi:MAG TPA: hypothetical protein VN969_00185 [Streptosporangiaceae bacterium]|nr:hypothetical protein [Streptosporangiaceae bacterium]